MAGEISSLGIGSGVLTADIIDKLRANDENALVKPIDTKIETNDSKVKALDLLDSLITTFQSSTGSLGDELLYLQREGSVAGEGVSVSVEDGVNIQEFSIRVDQLAKSDVVESGSFESTDKSIASGNGTLSININNKTYEVDYESTTTLENLRDEINKFVGDDLTASILQVGDNSNKLILTSKVSGADQEILMSDSGNLDSKILNKNAAVFGGDLTSTAPNTPETIADGDITINGTSIGEVVIPGTTNSEDKAGIIAQAINDAGVGATASVVEKNGKFSLYIENTDDGVGDLTITTNANGETLSGLASSTTTGNEDGATTIQEAKDAMFQYNGIDITRSTNEVSDLRNGITISLLKVKEDDEDLNNVSVTQ
ncbi:MAG: flagellar filament capping protein FliD, partial [Campylobacterota bacterium]|nr:flagellar filament capping protein FliD [Campylobacterota bacterium]